MESGGGGDEVVSEGEDEDNKDERERKSDGDENDSDKEVLESTSGGPGDDCPFILPKKWMVNDFLPTMSDKVFNTLRDCYQISNNIPICLPRKFVLFREDRRRRHVWCHVHGRIETASDGTSPPVGQFFGVSVSQIAPHT